MGSVIGLDGKRINDRSEFGINKWPHNGKRKCHGDQFCEGLVALVIDGAKVRGSRVAAVGDVSQSAGAELEAVGYYLDQSNRLLMFNFCPCCGAALKLPENRVFNG
jgi:hypothetical protein